MVAGFLDNAQPIRLAYIGGLSYNLESLNQYVFGQAGSSIKAWMMLHDRNIDFFLDSVFSKSLNDRQNALIQKMSAIREPEKEKDSKKSNGELILEFLASRGEFL